MRYSTDYYFTDGRQEVLLATYYFDGKKIWYAIRYGGETIESPHFDPKKLPEHLDHIIHLPILRSRLRAKTLPFMFEEVQRNTLEHFRSIRHNSSYYKFSPIVKDDHAGSKKFVQTLSFA